MILIQISSVNQFLFLYEVSGIFIFLIIDITSSIRQHLQDVKAGAHNHWLGPPPTALNIHFQYVKSK